MSDDTCPNGAKRCSNAPDSNENLECFACFIDDTIDEEGDT